ncbi:MAG: formylglycine-generating enzyme family protein [Prevotellaceae bacterium]|jgi:gliding motility-associated lipoprotein GldK|nr:formylglycine-generating enzyme family protein [Prevotellaceae bacterium]
MKNLFLLFVLAALLGSCGKGGGLFSGKSKYGFESQPENMVWVPAGSFQMGSSDEDIMWAMNSTQKSKTIDNFWMDATEVSNLEYRRFIGWVADSIARSILAEASIEGFIIEDDSEDAPAKPLLNWKTKINIKKNEDHLDALKNSTFFYSREESLTGRRDIDTRRIMYEFEWIDLEQAARAKWDPAEEKYIGTVRNAQGEVEEIVDRSSFIMRDRIYIYPDTLCWIRDFQYSYNDPWASQYFSHPSYDQYPVVGITWKQARAYAHWKSNFATGKKYKKEYDPHAYRLPTEVEFEYAARGGLNGAMYPWGSPYVTNKHGCYLANFKPQRGDYALDGGARTMPTATYTPNDYGLYDMAGNVAEWVEDAYDENSYEFTHDLVPVYKRNAKESDHSSLKRKVVRGGSWKDVSYFIQCGSRSYDYQDTAKSYIGFRTIRQILGTHND